MDKKKKAAIAAVMLYLEQEKPQITTSNWKKIGTTAIMNNRKMLQSRGRLLKFD